MAMATMGTLNQISKLLNIDTKICYNYKLSSSSSILCSSTKRKRFHQMKKTRVAMATSTPTLKASTAAVSVTGELGTMTTLLELTALVTVRNKLVNNVKDMMKLQWIRNPVVPGVDPHQKADVVVLQLVSTELTETSQTKPKRSEEATLDWTKNLKMDADDHQKSTYQVKFKVDSKFGMPGAITLSNRYDKEFYLESINIEGVVYFACNSWVQPHKVHPLERIFFSSKAYLHGETPKGLRELREMDLRQLRGDGTGLRLPSDRIYDYDTYNDIGDPHKGIEYMRPILGGNDKNPHPRRCRTGRPRTKTDEDMEAAVNEMSTIYVPRDEEFEEAKQEALDVGKLKGILRHIIPTVTTIARDYSGFKAYSEINGLYSDTSLLETNKTAQIMMKRIPWPKIFNKVQENLKFDPPKLISKDTSCCLRDDEFGRQTVAGINPVSIERLTTFPPRSKLDPSIYGSQHSVLNHAHLIPHLHGMSVQQAMEENKLFILDYHDMFLPFLNEINGLDDRKAYTTRTIFLLTSLGTLKPIAIELSLPPTTKSADSPSNSKQVLTPPVDATTNWLWQLGKAHVCSNDAGVRQLVHHWYVEYIGNYVSTSQVQG